MESHGYEPALEHDVESRFTVANGFLGIRGSLDLPTVASRARTFIAGLFDNATEKPAVPTLLYAPDWLRLSVLVNGKRLSLNGSRGDEQRVLDLARGVLISTLKLGTDDGRSIALRSLRFASLAKRHVAVQLAMIVVDNPARLRLVVSPAGTLVYDVSAQKRYLAVQAESQTRLDRERVLPADPELGELSWTWDAGADETAWLSRAAAFAVAGSADAASLRARELVGKLGNPAAVHRLYQDHVRAWKQRWSKSDVVVEGDEASQKALRFAIYHLVSAANPEDEHVSVGARSLTGDSYKGHVFWDTEIFMLPFYTLTWPEAARAMLMYRFHTLPAARAKAEKLGFRGALYAWESADSGEETTPAFALDPRRKVIPILSGVQEHHISADIAYAVWQYWQATRDTRFLLDAGAEILLETSRFWASRTHLDDDGHYHIRGVIGPDEYHEPVDDNAYTNVMAAYNIECGLRAARLLGQRWPHGWTALKARLHLSPDELAHWAEVQDRIYTGFDPETGFFEQFAGFRSLEDVDLKAFADRTVPMDVVLGSERTSRSKVVKQADVVQLLALLNDRYDRKVQEANFAYYEPLTGHGSSLSPPAHALVAARLGRTELAQQFFDETAAIDFNDTMGNAAGGVHIGALGGLWQAAVFGFAGLSLRESGLHFEPHLPHHWQRLAFPVQWRRRLFRIQAAGHTMTVTLEKGRPTPISIGELKRHLNRGETWRCVRRASGQWEELDSG